MSSAATAKSGDTPYWHIETLGELRVVGPARQIVSFQTKKTALLLTVLALQGGRTLSRDEVAEVVWEEGDPQAVRHRLSQALHSLRKSLAGPRQPALIASQMGVGLNTQVVSCDAVQFRKSLSLAGKATDPATKVRHLEEAIKTYRGEFLPGFYSDWVQETQQDLHREYLLSLSSLRSLYTELNDLDQAREVAWNIVKLEPLEEENHFELIRLLAKSEQYAAAMRQYRELERILETELGANPSAATITLIEQIRGRDLPGGLPEKLITKAADDRPMLRKKPFDSFPAQYTRFFGREDEIGQITADLAGEHTRLITLTGAGGSGKTRLSIQVAANVKEQSKDAVWFIPLTEALDESQVLGAILRTLRPDRSASSSPEAQIVAEIDAWEAPLLVIDNLDHLLEAAARVVQRLLDQCENLKCLVTSRQRLNIESEREIFVQPLEVPKDLADVELLAGYPCVQLFVDRARLVNPKFELSVRNAEAVASLAQRLEGIPLAIELAASWAETLTPDQILAELSQRFNILVSRRRDIPSRHRTLRAAVEYGYQLLPPELSTFYSKLSVCQGGWTLEAASAICSQLEARDFLSQLCERSLVIAEEALIGAASEMRYRMLDTLREYGWEQLSGDRKAELGGRHADYYVSLAVEAEKQFAGPRQAEAFSRLDQDHENILCALRWCEAHRQIDMGLQLSCALSLRWEVRGPREEGLHWLSTFLKDPEGSPALRAKALTALGRLAWCLSNFKLATAAHEECMAIQRTLGDSLGVASSLYNLGIVAVRQTDYQRARELMQESFALASKLGDKAIEARAMLNLGNVATNTGDTSSAKLYFERSLELERELENPERVAGALNNLGNLARIVGQFSLAAFYLEEALKLYEAIGSAAGRGLALLNLGKVALRRQDAPRALMLLASGLSDNHKVGNLFFIREVLVEMASASFMLDKLTQGAKLLAMSDRLTEDIGVPLPPSDRPIYDESFQLMSAFLSVEEIQAIRAECGLLSQSQMIVSARELVPLTSFAIDCLSV